MSKLAILFLVCFSFVVHAQESVLRESISNAKALKFHDRQINVTTAKSTTSFEMQRRLSRPEIEKIEQEIVGRGFVKVSEPSMSKDGSIFVLAHKGQGSQLMLTLLVSKDGNVTQLQVIKVTPTSIIYVGGKIQLSGVDAK